MTQFARDRVSLDFDPRVGLQCGDIHVRHIGIANQLLLPASRAKRQILNERLNPLTELRAGKISLFTVALSSNEHASAAQRFILVFTSTLS